MMGVKSSESAKHDADQGDENPGGGAGFGFLVVAHEPSVLHEPAKGALDHPAFGQHLEAAGVVAALRKRRFSSPQVRCRESGSHLRTAKVKSHLQIHTTFLQPPPAKQNPLTPNSFFRQALRIQPLGDS